MSILNTLITVSSLGFDSAEDFMYDSTTAKVIGIIVNLGITSSSLGLIACFFIGIAAIGGR